MSRPRTPKYDETIDGHRVRVFASRSEYEVLIGDGDIADPDADVRVYPKLGTPDVWAQQGLLDWKATQP